MKGYICDICNRGVEDPYEAEIILFKMKWVFDMDARCDLREKIKDKKKICICKSCQNKIIKYLRSLK